MKVKNRTRFFIKLIWLAVLVPIVVFILLIFLINLEVFGPMPTFEDLENPQSKLATRIYSEDMEQIGTYHLENRSHVSFRDLDTNLVKALLATEDVRFMKHSGIDYLGMGRVFVRTVLMADRKSGGGSTITQQLALNLFAERSSNIFKRLMQKLQEWVTAVKLERSYTKEEIMAMYFNTVPYGSNAFGIRSATQTFFGKEPKEINLQEAALMVGVVNAPTFYSPVRNPERSKQRRDLVLGQMYKYGYINKQVYDSVTKLPIVLNFQPLDHNSGIATYFREMLRQTMRMKKPNVADYKYKGMEEYSYDSLQWETNPLYGWCNKNLKNGRPYDLDRDGLKIYTTINAKMQKYAEEAVDEHLSLTLQPAFDGQKKNRKRFPFSNYLSEKDVKAIIDQGIRNSDRYKFLKKMGTNEDSILESFQEKIPMTVFSWKNPKHEVDTIMSPIDSIFYYKSLIRAGFMAMEPRTGCVRAYVGGPTFRYLKYDNVWQGRRQVGSTIKPFLYTLAIQEGMTPCDKIINNYQSIPLPDGKSWEPKSTEKKHIGEFVTLRWGLANSSNNISASLIQRFSPESLVDLCHRMGIISYMDPVVSVCLGPSDISLMQMVKAYNTYPSGGINIDPYFVTRIEDSNGNTLATFTKQEREVIDKVTAYTAIELMKGVINMGTGARVKSYLPSAEVAGKTGTTNNNADGWFIGYVPKLTAGVWIGNEDRGAYLLADGSRMALPIWGIFFKKVMADPSLGIRVTDKFEIPEGMDMRILNCKDLTDEEGSEYEENVDEEQFFF